MPAKAPEVFLAGRTRAKLEALAAEINAAAQTRAAGGQAEVGVVDALNEAAVEEHLRAVVARAGSVDVSFNLITRGDVQGIPLLDMTPADYTRAVVTGLTTHFLTARASARRMVDQGSGVILMLTSASATGAPPMMGSTPPADAAIEAFMRCLAAEVGPSGVRVLGLWTAGVPETLTPESIAAVNGAMQMDSAALEQLKQQMNGMTLLRRMPALARVADAAAFLASDRAGAITATMINVTSGLVVA